METTTSTNGPDFVRKVENAIKEAIHDLGAGLPADSGVAVAIIEDNKVCLTGGFGLRDRENGATVNAATTFAIGSATKAFTSLLACKLIEEEKIKLDDPIKKVLQDFRLREKDASNGMTLEIILSHKTGLPRHDALWYLTPFTRPQLFYRLRHLDPGAADFNKKFTYNNMMYGVAGDVLEFVSKETWGGLVKSRILDNMEMPSTTFSVGDLVGKPNAAKGYCRNKFMPLRDFSNIAPAGAINSNVIDMAEWIMVFLRGGVASNGKRIVSQDSVKSMLKDRADADPTKKLDTKLCYGLGWYMCTVKDKDQNKELFFHQGDADGHTAYASFMPDPGLGVVVLTNQQCTPELVHKWPDAVAEKIYGLLLGHPVDLPDVRALRAMPPREPSREDVVKPEDYTGMYSNDGYGDVTVVRRGAGLNISYYGRDFDALRQKSQTQFEFNVPALGLSIPVPATFRKAGNDRFGRVEIDFTPFDKKSGPVAFDRR
jgi:CubicO group peptidase (beta-lactamase class C family)